ncbi:signal recognition particle, SRP19 subunit [Kockiozyma suomiensis]|uniref:signal recognition particle, SRP19 subunit n=1 Tax=Kockiozyma suomiensis TaxID=1337062 RepID=UPI003343889F
MLEEVDDIDDMDFDPADFDPRKVLAAIPSGPEGAGPANLTAVASSSSGRPQSQQPQSIPKNLIPQGMNPSQVFNDDSTFKEWQILYPVYFDVSRTHNEGRRVNSELAIENPLAHKIAEACSSLGMRTFLDPQKTHPKDWANPGRVRIMLKDPETHALVNPRVKNKRDLYRQICEYLKLHPTIPSDALKIPIPGVPSEIPEPPAVPRGWKINKVLPVHSAALTGGGVNDDIFKDMAGMPGMEQLAAAAGGGKMPPGLAGLPGGMKGLEALQNMAGGAGGMGGLANMMNAMGGMGGMGGLGGLGGLGGGAGGATPSGRGGRRLRK